MNWRKLGNAFLPKSEDKYTHAMFPEVEVLDEQNHIIRIYYTHRDKNNYGFPTYMDACLSGDEFSIIYNHHEPIMPKGDIGNFDDSGANITSMIKIDGKRRFYYYGWNLGITVPFRNAIGVAEENNHSEMALNRLFPGPILDRSHNFPGLCATPCVIKVGNLYRMYFTQGTPWIVKEQKPNIACNIYVAESSDGLYWERSCNVAVDNLPTDHVITTPFVLFEDGVFKMWYSYRGEKYRIGYADSVDGLVFQRKDQDV